MKKSLSKDFKQLLDFIDFTHEFREITRVARSPHGKRLENDTEHSYQLAMVAWFLIDKNKLNLDKNLCLNYALAHDLVEVYAGDTYIFGKKSTLASKHKREKAALVKIKKRFSHFKDLIKTIEAYESKRDNESKFIYALDKIIPPIQIFLEEGILWQEYKVTFEDLMENKHPKIASSPEIMKYWVELSKVLTKNKKKLFFRRK